MEQVSSKLAEALSKAQGAIKAAEKNSENPAFKKKDGKASKYANIEEVIAVIQEPAAANGLSVVFNFKEENGAQIQYVIFHSSGEKFESNWVSMYMRDKTQHSFGAANTYMRRQLLKAIYQIPEEEDDGNSQSIQTEPKKELKNYAPSAAKADYSHNGNSSSLEGRILDSQPGSAGHGSHSGDALRTPKIATYTVPFGKKYLGKRLDEMSPDDIRSYSNFLKKDGEPKGNAKEFISLANEYLAGLDGPPPFAPFNSDEEIPF